MRLNWGQVGTKRYETGSDHGVLYLPDNLGNYDTGVPWVGLTTVTETPTGAEANKQYADNSVYVNIQSAEEFGATVEAFTYPDEFEQCDGTATPSPGVAVGQQGRRMFGFSYRTLIGNDTEGIDHGYKLHLVYGCQAAPSERAYTTVNESPEAQALSWEITTTPVTIPGTNPVTGKEYKPTSILTIDSTKVDADSLTALEDLLYGTAGTDAELPLPAQVIALFAGTVIEAETVPPSYNAATDIVTIPAVTGVIYSVEGVDVAAGPYGPITEDTVVEARPADGYSLTETSDSDWTINFA